MSKVKETNLKIAQKLAKIRQQNNLTQEDFAKKIGITRQAVSRWEMGISAPASKTLIRISEEFNIPLDKIISDDADIPEAMNGEKSAILMNFIKFDVLLICVGLIGIISLPFFAEMKQTREMELFKSAYEHAYHYILEFPLFIILFLALALLVVGTYLLLKRKFFYEEKND